MARLLVVMFGRQLSESEKVVLQRAFEIVSSLRGDELGSNSAATPEMESTARYNGKMEQERVLAFHKLQEQRT